MLRSAVRIIAAGSVAAAIFACGGGGGDGGTGPSPVFTSVVVSPASPTVAVGSTTTLAASAKDQNGANFAGAPAATWSSSNTAMATVDPNSGVVSGIANGTSTITASITVGSVTHSGSQDITVSTPGATASVTAAVNQSFEPPTVTIVRSGGNGSVTWTFQSLAHTVTWDSQPSGANVTDIAATHDASVLRPFTVAGTYAYHCSIHPGMTGSVIVQ